MPSPSPTIQVQLVDGPLSPRTTSGPHTSGPHTSGSQHHQRDGAAGSPQGIPALTEVHGAGALIVFEGVVRPQEPKHPAGESSPPSGQSLSPIPPSSAAPLEHITGLSYETYDPLTERELRRLGERIAQQHELDGMWITHSRGFVPSGMISFRLAIAARRRKAALRGMDTFIDEMKRYIPIWKLPVWSG